MIYTRPTGKKKLVSTSKIMKKVIGLVPLKDPKKEQE